MCMMRFRPRSNLVATNLTRTTRKDLELTRYFHLPLAHRSRRLLSFTCCVYCASVLGNGSRWSVFLPRRSSPFPSSAPCASQPRVVTYTHMMVLYLLSPTL